MRRDISSRSYNCSRRWYFCSCCNLAVFQYHAKRLQKMNMGDVRPSKKIVMLAAFLPDSNPGPRLYHWKWFSGAEKYGWRTNDNGDDRRLQGFWRRAKRAKRCRGSRGSKWQKTQPATQRLRACRKSEKKKISQGQGQLRGLALTSLLYISGEGATRLGMPFRLSSLDEIKGSITIYIVYLMVNTNTMPRITGTLPSILCTA